MSAWLRAADLAWAAAAAQDLSGLDWVDIEESEDLAPYSQRQTEAGTRWRHLPYGAFLPPAMADAAAEARARGEPTLLDGLVLLFARIEWLIATRRLVWTALSPVPRRLAYLAELHGVGPEIHGLDPERLARLVARMPAWRRRRGELPGAVALLEAVTGSPVSGAWLDRREAGEAPPALRDEVLACRSGSWWAERRRRQARQHLRIEAGFVRFQPLDSGPRWALLQEDVLVVRGGEDLARALLRLLPPWSSVRVALRFGDSP